VEEEEEEQEEEEELAKLYCKLHFYACFVLPLKTNEGINICRVLCLGFSVLVVLPFEAVYRLKQNTI
jgi:hypothetical protein